MADESPQADVQRSKLLTIAREKFAQNGFEATTTREINKAAGTAESLLYYYFPHGKKQLLDTIVRDGVLTRTCQLTVDFSKVRSVTGLEKKIMAVFDELWQVFADEASYQSFLITIRERALLSPEQAGWLETALATMVQQLASAFDKVAPSLPQLQPQDHATFARVIVAVFQKSLYDELLIRDNRQISAASRASVQQDIHLLLQLAAKGE